MLKTKFGVVALLAGAMAVSAPVVVSQLSTPAQAGLQAVLPSFAPLVRETQPSVVTIQVAGRPGGRAQPQIDPQMREFMERFFGRNFPGQSPQNSERQVRGLGSGFIIDPKGFVVTNNHVIEGGDEITVVLNDGTELVAELVGSDPKTDLAVLRVEAGVRLPAVGWANSDKVEVGDWAIAIGSPFGLGSSVTAGIVSARGRNIQSGPYDDYMQVDAPINRGNSGGPLFDQLGKVIGVNTAIFSPSGGNVGIGFAIPANQARDVVEDLIDDGSVDRGWLGVSIQPVTSEIADAIGLEDVVGAMISELVEDGPAASGGLKRGDVILSFDGQIIDTVRDLTRTVADTDPGKRAKVRVFRRGEEETVTIRTGRFPT
ncbi:MAG: Do family serine endopeptidase [Paracoccaceae bacterium]